MCAPLTRRAERPSVRGDPSEQKEAAQREQEHLVTAVYRHAHCPDCMLLRCGSARFRSTLRPAAHSPALLAAMTAPLASSVAARPLSPTSSLDAADAGQPAAKRQRTSKHNDDGDEQLPTTKTPRKRSSQQLPYHIGMHLAPMVRIGTLPVRLVGELLPLLSSHPFPADGSRAQALEYGAELVWGPEIVDKAIIGAERKVDRE